MNFRLKRGVSRSERGLVIGVPKEVEHALEIASDSVFGLDRR